MVALIVDGGNAFAQQRITQNGTDAAAEAGATVLAQRLGGATKTDEDVIDAVTAIATAGEMEVAGAGAPTWMATRSVSAVGSLGGAAPPSNASGVAVTDIGRSGRISRARSASTRCAVAKADWRSPALGRPVAHDAARRSRRPGERCPATASTTLHSCSPTPLGDESCTRFRSARTAPETSAGSTGTRRPAEPRSCATSILDPSGTPAIPVPSWRFITATGNVNSKPVETSLRQYDGQVVLIPIFDYSACNTEPTGTGIELQNVGGLGGQGTAPVRGLQELLRLEHLEDARRRTRSLSTGTTHRSATRGAEPRPA